MAFHFLFFKSESIAYTPRVLKRRPRINRGRQSYPLRFEASKTTEGKARGRKEMLGTKRGMKRVVITRVCRALLFPPSERKLTAALGPFESDRVRRRRHEEWRAGWGSVSRPVSLSSNLFDGNRRCPCFWLRFALFLFLLYIAEVRNGLVITHEFGKYVYI